MTYREIVTEWRGKFKAAKLACGFAPRFAIIGGDEVDRLLNAATDGELRFVTQLLTRQGVRFMGALLVVRNEAKGIEFRPDLNCLETNSVDAGANLDSLGGAGVG